MYFTSYEFIGFMAVTLVLYYLIPKRAQWMLLLTASAVFYALNGVTALFWTVGTGLTVHFSALLLDKLIKDGKAALKENEALTKEEKAGIRRKYANRRNLTIVLCLTVNIGALAFVKVSGLFAVLGISYYTLRAIGYLMDVNRGTVKAERNFFRFMLYLTFFPVVIQGPLTDYGKLTETLYGEHRFSWENIGRGLLRVLWGFFKKLVLADRVFVAVSAIVENESSFRGPWVLAGMALYTLELYADFTGGIDITIGISEMLGIRVQENFDRPFFSPSVKEYWRHWHISMAAWFRTYLFYPISVCPPMKKLLKFTRKHFGEKAGKRIPVYISSAIVWFATGLWHGPAANYITWAMLHFAILMISEELEPLYEAFHKKCAWASSKPYRVFMSLRTLFIVSALMQFDIFTSVPLYFKRFASVFTPGTAVFADLGLNPYDWVILMVGTLMMFAVSLLKGDGSLSEKLWQKPYICRTVAFAGLFLAVILFGMYGPGYDAGQFIYTRF